MYIYIHTAPSIPPAISNITLSGITQLTWSEIPCNFQNGPLDHYSIHLYNSTTCSGTYNSFKSKDLLFTFHNLRPYTNYCISIAQVNIGNLTGPYSSGYNILTPESGKYIYILYVHMYKCTYINKYIHKYT